MAMRTLPSVPFLNPTGQERPEASSRCTWLSVVRAPMAPHETRSAIYCGVIMSRNSDPAGMPDSFNSSRSLPRQMQSLVDPEAAVEVGIVDQTLPTDRRARFLEIDAHNDQQIVGAAVLGFLELGGVFLGGFDVVDRARPHDDQQTVIGAVQNAMDLLARLVNRPGCIWRDRKITQ